MSKSEANQCAAVPTSSPLTLASRVHHGQFPYSLTIKKNCIVLSQIYGFCDIHGINNVSSSWHCVPTETEPATQLSVLISTSTVTSWELYLRIANLCMCISFGLTKRSSIGGIQTHDPQLTMLNSCDHAFVCIEFIIFPENSNFGWYSIINNRKRDLTMIFQEYQLE